MPNNNPQQQASQQREGSSKLTDRIEKTADQTTSSAIQRVRDAREQATSGLEHQRAEVANRIRRLGGVIRAGSETLSTDDPYSQNLLTVAGDRVIQAADYIENLTPGQIADDLQTFARRRPGLFFGSAFLIGLGLGRFAKSTTRAVGPSSNSYGADSYGADNYEDEDFPTADYAGESSTATQQRTAGLGQSSPSYGTAGSSGSYGVGGTGSSTGSSTGTAGTGTLTGSAGTSTLTGSGSSTGASTSGSTGYGQGVGGTGGYGIGSTAPQGTGTPSATPKETDRGQGSKS